MEKGRNIGGEGKKETSNQVIQKRKRLRTRLNVGTRVNSFYCGKLPRGEAWKEKGKMGSVL